MREHVPIGHHVVVGLVHNVVAEQPVAEDLSQRCLADSVRAGHCDAHVGQLVRDIMPRYLTP